MLGYDATFGVIDAIKFAQQSSLFYKRVGKEYSTPQNSIILKYKSATRPCDSYTLSGYLVSSLLLDPGREESLLLCCSLQKVIEKTGFHFSIIFLVFPLVIYKS